MTIDDKIRDKMLQHDANREASKISVLLSGNVNMNILQVNNYCLLIKDK